MRVTRVVPVTSQIVDIEGTEWGVYRRHSADNWEVLMGESWEPLYECEDAETAYQYFKKG